MTYIKVELKDDSDWESRWVTSNSQKILNKLKTDNKDMIYENKNIKSIHWKSYFCEINISYIHIFIKFVIYVLIVHSSFLYIHSSKFILSCLLNNSLSSLFLFFTLRVLNYLLVHLLQRSVLFFMNLNVATDLNRKIKLVI